MLVGSFNSRRFSTVCVVPSSFPSDLYTSVPSPSTNMPTAGSPQTPLNSLSATCPVFVNFKLLILPSPAQSEDGSSSSSMERMGIGERTLMRREGSEGSDSVQGRRSLKRKEREVKEKERRVVARMGM